MRFSGQHRAGFGWRAWVAVACVGLCCGARPAVSSWDAAVEARAQFEAEPAGTHSRAEYTRVMDGFRAIYHSDPGAAHAARAVEQVAELLAEQGREFRDTKSLRAAAGQYEFLAKAYPGGTIAPKALASALELLGPDAADDPLEAAKVKRQLEAVYPKYARSVAAGRPAQEAALSAPAPLRADGREDSSVVKPARAAAVPAEVTVAAAKPAATVTGIRHWSTTTYTRVAIDLGDEVQYQAARVENPDRIFFDLHHARLAPQLEGKSFAVTDDGFLTRIRAAQFSDDVTRVVLDVHEVSEYSAFLLPNPYRLIIDIHGKQGAGSKEPGAVNGDAGPAANAAPAGAAEMSSLPPMPVTDGSAAFAPTVARPVPNTVTRSSAQNGTEVAAVSDQPGKVVATRRPTSQPISSVSSDANGDRYVPRTRRVATATPSLPVSSLKGEPAEAAAPTADGETSLVRALGLKIGRIVIDAGHGGHDSGTLGAGGIEEKDVVLDVALRLGRLLHDRLGAEIVYTRSDDTFIPLETRTAIANKAQADLFLSVHANSSPDASARGVEVYYLNFTSDPDAMRVASRENAVSTQSVHELSDLVKKIALKDKIDESKELATDVDESLYAGLRKGNPGLKDRGVKKAPFVVLIGANMPSILAEISFVTNPDDAAQLQTPEYRERVAESLYGGVAKYAAGINGPARVKVAAAKARTTERAAVK